MKMQSNKNGSSLFESLMLMSIVFLAGIAIVGVAAHTLGFNAAAVVNAVGVGVLGSLTGFGVTLQVGARVASLLVDYGLKKKATKLQKSITKTQEADLSQAIREITNSTYRVVLPESMLTSLDDYATKLETSEKLSAKELHRLSNLTSCKPGFDCGEIELKSSHRLVAADRDSLNDSLQKINSITGFKPPHFKPFLPAVAMTTGTILGGVAGAYFGYQHVINKTPPKALAPKPKTSQVQSAGWQRIISEKEAAQKHKFINYDRSFDVRQR